MKSTAHDVIVIGGGHNGLVAAALLAKAGLNTTVLERSERVGGCAVTSEIAPGFRVPTLAHRAAIDPELIKVLDLERHGLAILEPDALACSPTRDGRALTIWRNAARTAAGIGSFSTRDAAQYEPFVASVGAVCRFLRSLIAKPPPSIDLAGPADFLGLIADALKFRSLGQAHAYRLLRWLPMPVADFTHEWFESEPLCATVAAGALLGAFAGPRSPGTTATLLLLAAGDGQPIAPGWTARGGVGAVSDALAAAAQSAGAAIRTGAAVSRILVKDETATGIVLTTGEEVEGRLVLSCVDPRATFLDLIGPEYLEPDFFRAVQNIRTRGTLAKINFAVSAVPDWTALRRMNVEERQAAVSGCVRLGQDLDSIERAFDAVKYGAFSEEPWIELTLPSLADPVLAPPGLHVVSAYVQFVPCSLRGTTWETERDRFADLVTRAIDSYAPGFARSVLARQVITPADLERTFGLAGGHVFHGELALDQLFVGRPLFGWSRYRTPIRNLFLGGAGTHPGTGLDGRSGRLAAREIIRQQ